MKSILYIGPNQSEWADANCPGSIAAAKWSRGLLSALSKLDKVLALTHTYYYPWPKGAKLWSARDNRLYPSEWECEVVTYPILRYVRECWWRLAYWAKVNQILSSRSIDAILVYNCYERWLTSVLRKIKHKYPMVHIVPIILDGDDPRKDDWEWMKRAAQVANGFVALSWWMYKNIPLKLAKPSYHMDGGAIGWNGTPPRQSYGSSRVFTIVHTGELDKWRGLDFMIRIMDRLFAKRKDVKFVFCGRVGIDTLVKKFGNNPQVQIAGFVAESRLNEICREAAILLNVRDPSQPDNILNYPSKIAQYLSFGRPVISTRLESLSPDYDDVIVFADQVGGHRLEDAFLERIDDVLAWDIVRQNNWYMKTKKWFEERKSWRHLAEGLSSWIDSLL